ncbi:hypothetical protein HOLleu_33148 [Holothuria leucospilota]|uniref:CCHC-type domain-containing protein n=1 Tax=Holothuria leucospilota TaxID=206669 RepID=A0A9Q0YRT0_HOLLE|nr:hypothetical protein HOLleu_33148 [Holothuria leucospilota]
MPDTTQVNPPENDGDRLNNSVPWSYIPMDFRIPIFYGIRTSPNDPSFQEWKAEVELAFKVWHTPEDQKAEFVIRYLGGEAKREVLVMDKRDKIDDVMKLLESIYGDKMTVTTVLSKFYGRAQGALEGVRNYALSLQELSKRIPNGASESISDKSLRDRFVDGLRSESLKSELKRTIRLKPLATFAEIKEESLVIAVEKNGLEQEIEAATQLHQANNKRSSSKESELHGLKTAIEQIQSQIKELQKQVGALKNSQSYDDRQGYYEQPRSFRPVICYECHGEGHIARQCPHRYGPRQSGPPYLN